ncbi:MAG TPA: polyribonucleotide nucleotidyltransferase, partial [Candidatus Babeliaceae bacterium]|nr:polyribonucleotide nucleotidyltransferase [Candidatus Babeliaceae bacterium]
EILVGRLIDRAIRPLFPSNYFNQIQGLSTVYSVDKEHTPHTLALLGTSIALTISKIPFMGPIGVAEIVQVNGQWIVNPTYSQSVQSSTQILLAGTEDGICMVEGSANQISEQEFIDLLFMAHEKIKQQVQWQKNIAQELGITKEPIIDQFDWPLWRERVEVVLSDENVSALFTKDKVERNEKRAALKEDFLTRYAQEITETQVSETFLEYIFDNALRNAINERIFALNQRIDKRTFTEIRTIKSEVGLLPYNHGSALFQRGRTQALVSVTLGGGQDEARTDSLMGETVEGSFMLHYNFPPFSVGEVRPSRGPGRREVGHGYLAASAIKQVLPQKTDFPYTIRIVADILESDGSSSMATVCGSSLALMDGGIPISKIVAGIAMGLLKSEQDSFIVLSDIAGIEDEFGLMDFKVAGTQDGITAIQMDIKYKKGLPREVFERALAQAKEGRLFILQEMKKTISAPREKVSVFVPQIVSFKIPREKIGAVIGSGGKVIKEIIEKTGTTIDIEDEGLVKIFGHPGPKLDQAISWVKALAGLVERGSRYSGKIKRIADFGVFVEIAPGIDGLVHISSFPRKDQNVIMKQLQIGETIEVEVLDYEAETGRIRLKIISPLT